MSCFDVFKSSAKEEFVEYLDMLQEDDFLPIIDGGYNLTDVVINILVGAFCGIELHYVFLQNQSLLASSQLCNLLYKLSSLSVGNKASRLDSIKKDMNLGV